MTKRDDRGRLGVRSERLRQLTGLSTADLDRVGGGTMTLVEIVVGPDVAGRVYSRTCCFNY